MKNDSRKVLVALSGGLDSAAVVLMLRESLYDVEALYLDMTGSQKGLLRARSVAQMLGVRLHVEQVGERFRSSIVDCVVQEHRLGRTPSPCGRCNPLIKWAVLCEVASRLGIWWVATGHYARVEQLEGASVIRRGVDGVKDQSYYLWGLSGQTLSRAVLPLGGLSKLQVRDYLRSRGFQGLGSSGESMSLCFLETPQGGRISYNEFLRQRLAGELRRGEVVNTKGVVVGWHDGCGLYTVGQRRGFYVAEDGGRSGGEGFIEGGGKLSGGEGVAKGGGGYSVVEICAKKNQLIVSDLPEDLYRTEILCGDLRCDHLGVLLGAPEISVVVRGLGRNPSGYAQKIEQLSPGILRVTLPSPGAWAVAPGQPVVFYKGDSILGGAIVQDQ